MNATPEKPIIVNHSIMNAPVKEKYDENDCKCELTTPICLDSAFNSVDSSNEEGNDSDDDDDSDDSDYGDDDGDGDDGNDDYFQEDEYDRIYEEDYEDCNYEVVDISDLRTDYLRYTRHVKDISLESYCNKNHIFYRDGKYIRYILF